MDQGTLLGCFAGLALAVPIGIWVYCYTRDDVRPMGDPWPQEAVDKMAKEMADEVDAEILADLLGQKKA